MGAFAAQFYEARSLETQLPDRTFHTWRYHVTTVCVQGLSIITVCIPYIRNLLLGMESGMIQTGHFRLPDRHNSEPENPLRLNFLNTGAKIAEPATCHVEGDNINKCTTSSTGTGHSLENGQEAGLNDCGGQVTKAVQCSDDATFPSTSQPGFWLGVAD